MRRPGILAGALGLAVSAGALAAQTAPPTPPPTAAAPRGAAKAPRAPLDFSGIWEIDGKESKGVSKNMEKAVIQIRQNGDRIWIEPIEQKRPWLSADEIVVDGKVYEKAIGAGKKGSVQASWGKDKKSLWIQTSAGTDENPNAAWTRSVWELRDGGKTWTRRTWSFQKDATRESFLVFRKRETKKP